MDTHAYFDDLDDTILERIFQELVDNGDYLTLSHLFLTNQRINKICQKFFDRLRDDRIVLLISFIGDRHDHFMPIAYITLDLLQSFVENRLQLCEDELLTNEDEEFISDSFYMTLPIPNRPLEPEGDFVLEITCDTDKIHSKTISYSGKKYDWSYDARTYQLLRSFIKKQYIIKIR